MAMPKLYILAGANGSGKSTIARVLLPTEGIVCVNPDEIAKELDRDAKSVSNALSRALAKLRQALS